MTLWQGCWTWCTAWPLTLLSLLEAIWQRGRIYSVRTLLQFSKIHCDILVTCMFTVTFWPCISVLGTCKRSGINLTKQALPAFPGPASATSGSGCSGSDIDWNTTRKNGIHIRQAWSERTSFWLEYNLETPTLKMKRSFEKIQRWILMKTTAPIRTRSIMKIDDWMSITSSGYSDYSVSFCCAASCPPPSWSASFNFLPSHLCYLKQCLCETGLRRMLGYKLRYRSSYVRRASLSTPSTCWFLAKFPFDTYV
jgi:hypothetical protein